MPRFPDGKMNDKKQQALDAGLLEAAATGDKDGVVRYLSLGAAPDARSAWGDGAVALAAQGRYATIVSLLLKAGADPDLRRDGGDSALMSATVFGRMDIAAALLERGADTGAANAQGNTALHQAAAFGREDIARLLLEAGADMAPRNTAGKTARDIAASRGGKTFLDLLRVAEKKRLHADIDALDDGLRAPVRVRRPLSPRHRKNGPGRR